MKWGKIVLLFQAVVTLVLGIAFFAQVLTIDIAKVSELKIQVESGDLSGNTESEYIDLKQRYAAASYILLFVSLIELIIITKLLKKLCSSAMYDLSHFWLFAFLPMPILFVYHLGNNKYL